MFCRSVRPMGRVSALVMILLLIGSIESSRAQEAAGSSECKEGPYDGTISKDRLEKLSFGDLPGFTRSVLERDHAVITPESRVYSPMPEWQNSTGAFLVTPHIGAHFSMAIVNMDANSLSAPLVDGAERFIFLLNGTIFVSGGAGQIRLQTAGEFAYFPSGSTGFIRSEHGANLLLFERIYMPHSTASEQPKFLAGNTEDLPNIETGGEVFRLKKLLPTSLAFDFNIHVMDFQPGEHLNVRELHYNQHGMIILQGRGLQRLSDRWYPVQAGDAMWMAPFVTQWYAALGHTRTRYLLYKDVNRHPLLT